MKTRQILLGGLLGALLGSAGLAIAVGGIGLLGIEFGVVGLRLAPDDIPTELRGALVLIGLIGILIWVMGGAFLSLHALRRRSGRRTLPPAAHGSALPMWYSGTPTIPHFTPPIPPPEQAYLSLTRPSLTFSQSDTRPQRPVAPLNIEHTQVPAMPSLLSYESLFPSEQTEQFVPPPPAHDETPDSAPTVPPPMPAATAPPPASMEAAPPEQTTLPDEQL